MRLVRGGAPGSSLAEMWSALRDDPGRAPVYGDQLAAHLARQDYAAPSEAHVKRLRNTALRESLPSYVREIPKPEASARELFMREQAKLIRAHQPKIGKLSQMRWDATHKRFVEA